MCRTSLTETCTRGLGPPLVARNNKGYPCVTIAEERVVGAFSHLDSYIILTLKESETSLLLIKSGVGGGGDLKTVLHSQLMKSVNHCNQIKKKTLKKG